MPSPSSPIIVALLLFVYSASAARSTISTISDLDHSTSAATNARHLLQTCSTSPVQGNCVFPCIWYERDTYITYGSDVNVLKKAGCQPDFSPSYVDDRVCYKEDPSISNFGLTGIRAEEQAFPLAPGASCDLFSDEFPCHGKCSTLTGACPDSSCISSLGIRSERNCKHDGGMTTTITSSSNQCPPIMVDNSTLKKGLYCNYRAYGSPAINPATGAPYKDRVCDGGNNVNNHCIGQVACHPTADAKSCQAATAQGWVGTDCIADGQSQLFKVCAPCQINPTAVPVTTEDKSGVCWKYSTLFGVTRIGPSFNCDASGGSETGKPCHGECSTKAGICPASSCARNFDIQTERNCKMDKTNNNDPYLHTRTVPQSSNRCPAVLVDFNGQPSKGIICDYKAYGTANSCQPGTPQCLGRIACKNPANPLCTNPSAELAEWLGTDCFRNGASMTYKVCSKCDASNPPPPSPSPPSPPPPRPSPPPPRPPSPRPPRSPLPPGGGGPGGDIPPPYRATGKRLSRFLASELLADDWETTE